MGVLILKASVPTLYLLLIAAVIRDFRFMKISNRLILVGLFISVAVQFAAGGFFQFLRHLPAVFFPVILLFPLFAARILGAGDIKLFSMIGGFLNFKVLCLTMVCSFVMAGVISLFHLLIYGDLFRDLQGGCFYLLRQVQGNFYPYPEGQKRNRMHFSLAILLGLAAAQLIRRYV